jgi:broad specificity phosphatase PhoE
MPTPFISRIPPFKRCFSTIVKNSEIVKKMKDSNSKVTILRHCESMFNVDFNATKLKYGYGLECRDIFLNDKYINPKLSLRGIQQCQSAAEVAKNVNFKLVIVSPYYRTMQTAHYILKNHPKYQNMKFIIHPWVREHFFGTSESTIWLEDDLKQFDFPNWDISPCLDKDGKVDELFYIRSMQKELQEEFKGKTKYEINQILKKAMINRFPRSSEFLDGTYDRTELMKKFIKDYLISWKKLEDKKVLVISHENYIRTWTAQWEDMAKPYRTFPEKTIIVPNGDFYIDESFSEY